MSIQISLIKETLQERIQEDEQVHLPYALEFQAAQYQSIKARYLRRKEALTVLDSLTNLMNDNCLSIPDGTKIEEVVFFVASSKNGVR